MLLKRNFFCSRSLLPSSLQVLAAGTDMLSIGLVCLSLVLLSANTASAVAPQGAAVISEHKQQQQKLLLEQGLEDDLWQQGTQRRSGLSTAASMSCPSKPQGEAG